MPKIIRNQTGATSIEYAVILGALVLLLLIGMKLTGGSSRDLWQSDADKAAAAMTQH